MHNNEVFNNILHITGLGRNAATKELLIKIFKMGGADLITESKIKGWRTVDIDANRASLMPDSMLHCFFQGLFKYRDSKKFEGVNVFNFENVK